MGSGSLLHCPLRKRLSRYQPSKLFLWRLNPIACLAEAVIIALLQSSLELAPTPRPSACI